MQQVCHLLQLVNMCANDSYKLFYACLMGVFVLSSLASLVGTAYSIYLLGWWGILGMGIFLVSAPVQVNLHTTIAFAFRYIN